MIRTFIAIKPPEPLREEFARLTDAFKKADAHVKWVRPESIHLTLKFLGDISEEDAPLIGRTLAAAVTGYGALDLRLEGTGVFPSPKKPRIVWVGLGGDIDRLAGLQRLVEAACERHGFEPENRPFKPHLTLGRVKSPRGRAALIEIMDHTDTMAVSFTAREVILYKSDLKPAGAVYTPIERLPLADENTEDEA